MNKGLPSAEASAPGSLMILGEYAVLRGYRALVCAVNRRARVRVARRADGRVRIDSELGYYEAPADALEDDEQFRFVLAVLRKAGQEVTLPGLDVTIESSIPAGQGLSSSAAIATAVAAAVRRVLGKPAGEMDVFSHALDAVRQVQGKASGADVAAAVWGGLLVYRMEPFLADGLPHLPELVVAYSGRSVSTPGLVREVEQRTREFPALFSRIFEIMDASVGEAELCLRREPPQWKRLGALLNLNQGLMSSLGVSSAVLESLVYELRMDSGVSGAKISGAGGGDCVIGLGRLKEAHPSLEILDVQSEPAGLQWHE